MITQLADTPQWSEFAAMTKELNRLAEDVAYWQKHHDALQRANNALTKRYNDVQRLADALKAVWLSSYPNGSKTSFVSNASLTEAREALEQWEKAQ